MAQADVINIKKRGDRHPDDVVLGTVAMWKLARMEARTEWARYDYLSRFDTVDASTKAPSEQLEIVARAEGHLANIEPLTTLGAKVLLDVVADILATSTLDPDAVFAAGPVLEIVVNVARALSCKDVQLKS